MGYERYPRDDHDGDRDVRGDGRYGRSEGSYGSGGDGRRDYAHDADRGYGASDYGYAGYARSDGDRGRSYGRGAQGYPRTDGTYGRQDGARRDDGRQDYGQQRYGQQRYGGYGSQDQGRSTRDYHGSYASDGHRWEDVGARRHWDDDNRSDGRNDGRNDAHDRGRYGGQPQGYSYEDRGFVARAGDEVRSWFGDEDAERRREMDSRYDERYYNQQGRHERDGDYHNWRSGQIAALDRDYDEYRRENRSKFENEFSSWRSNRQTQRQSLDQVKEHAEVVGSDGVHVGTVDKVRGDRIILTKNDSDAGGRHHSVPSNWLASTAGGKVTLTKTADEAKRHWRDEEQNQALFGDLDGSAAATASAYGTGRQTDATRSETGTTDLNRSFSGTYDKK